MSAVDVNFWDDDALSELVGPFVPAPPGVNFWDDDAIEVEVAPPPSPGVNFWDDDVIEVEAAPPPSPGVNFWDDDAIEVEAAPPPTPGVNFWDDDAISVQPGSGVEPGVNFWDDDPQQVDPVAQPAKVISARIIGDRCVRLTFSPRVVVNAALYTPSNYAFSVLLGPARMAYTKTATPESDAPGSLVSQVVVCMRDYFSKDGRYSIRVTGLTDEFGRTIDTEEVGL